MTDHTEEYDTTSDSQNSEEKTMEDQLQELDAALVMPDEMDFSYDGNILEYQERIYTEDVPHDPQELVEATFAEAQGMFEDKDADLELDSHIGSTDEGIEYVDLEITLEGLPKAGALGVLMSEVIGSLVASEPEYALQVMEPFYKSAYQMAMRDQEGQQIEIETKSAEDLKENANKVRNKLTSNGQLDLEELTEKMDAEKDEVMASADFLAQEHDDVQREVVDGTPTYRIGEEVKTEDERE